MLLYNNMRLIPFQKRNNLCFMMQDTNELIGIPRNSNILLFEGVFLEGIQNFVLISTLLLLARTLPNTTPPKAIIKITDPIINFSKKIISFDNYYFQIAISSAMLTYISTIAGVAAAEPKTKSAAKPANTSIKLYNPVMRLCNHFVAK
jgi:hypothetical protein